MLITTKGLTKTYGLGTPVEVHAVENVSLNIDSGEFIAIMGASGSGKSTLLNLIGCLDTPTSGSYTLGDIDIVKAPSLARVRREQIGFIFQSFNLIPQLTALHNVIVPMIYTGLSKKERQERARSLLETVGLADRAHHKPNQLSGGQKQRVAIARALANDPTLIIADEPTGNLDSKTSGTIMNILQNLNQKGTTMIMVTHEDDIAETADRTIRLHDGRIVEGHQQ